MSSRKNTFFNGDLSRQKLQIESDLLYTVPLEILAFPVLLNNGMVLLMMCKKNHTRGSLEKKYIDLQFFWTQSRVESDLQFGLRFCPHHSD